MTSAGVAASFSTSVTPGMFTLPGGLTITATLIKFEINTSTVAVDSLNVPAGPFLRVRVDNASLTLGSGGPTLNGSFLFDQSTRGGFAHDDDVRAERRDQDDRHGRRRR